MLLIVFGCDVQSAIVDVGSLLLQYMYVCICRTPAVSVPWLLMERHLSLLSHWSSAAQTVNDVDLGSADPRLNI